MSKRFFSLWFSPLLGVFLTPTAALAQEESKGYYATVYAQYSQIGSSTFSESGALGAGTGLRAEFGSGLGLGGDIGWRYGNGWAAEFEWNYRRHNLDTLTQGGGNLARDGDFASNILLLNGLYRFSRPDAWTPYVGAGVGWVQEIDIDLAPAAGGDERGYSDSGQFAAQLVAGVEYRMTPQWGVTADARWLRVGSVRLDNEVGNPDGSAGPLTYNPLSVQVGLRYDF
jgi:opacity protein-like surface antigen